MAPSAQELEFFRSFGCDLGLPSNNPEHTPAKMRAPTIELTPAADEFIKTHTAVDIEVPHDEECSICLENYREELCVRIRNLKGCTCRIGQVCLGELLSMNPLAEKKCPLCRAAWLVEKRSHWARDERVPRHLSNGGRRATAAADNRATQASTPMPQSVTNARPSATGRSASQAQILSATAAPFVPSRFSRLRFVGQDAYHTHFDTLSRSSRDAISPNIENLRARKRSTQLSSSQRRQDVRDQTARQRADDRESNNEDPLTVSSATQVGQDVAYVFRDELNFMPLPGSARTRSSIHTTSTSAQTPATPYQAQQTAHTPTMPTRRTSDRRRTNRYGLPVANTQRNEPSSVDNTIVSAIEAATPRPSNPDNFSHKNNRASNVDRREATLEQRETKLTKRKRDLEKREIELNKRAKLVDKHEAIAARKERDSAARAERAEAMIRMVQEHKGEMKELVRKQRVEMEKVMKKQQEEMRWLYMLWARRRRT